MYKPKGYSKAFNGIKLTLFNSMMYNSSVGFYLKLLKKLPKPTIGLKNYTQELWSHLSHVDHIQGRIKRFLWIFHYLFEANLHQRIIDQLKNA